MSKKSRKTLRSDEHKALRQLLIEVRKQSGMTQTQVAEALNWPQSDISKIETGERRLDVVEFVKLCRAIGEDPCDLIKKIRG